MKDISYLILHYNRPYLLDINIKLLKKYYPDMQFVLADDGSRKDVISKVKQMGFNDIYIQKNNQNTWTKGTCSNTIRSTLELCKNEYLIFSEDDFMFVPYGVENHEATEEQIVPDIKFPKEKTIDVFSEAINVLSNHKNIINIGLAKDRRRFRQSSPLISNSSIKWEYVDHAKKKTCYYSNWPSMTRIEDFRRVKIRKGQAIWSFESYFTNKFSEVFGMGNWIVMPEKRFYVHTGMPFSQRLNNFKFSDKRIKFGQKIQQDIFKKIVTCGLEDFNKFLLDSWVRGQFFIDFDEIIETDLNTAFVSAFVRLSKYI